MVKIQCDRITRSEVPKLKNMGCAQRPTPYQGVHISDVETGEP